MTGWNQDEKTINFVKEMKNKIDQNKDLMPDAWYWLCLEVDLDLNLQSVSEPHRKRDDDYIEWLKKDSELLLTYMNLSGKTLKQIVDEQDEWSKENIGTEHYDTILN